MFGGEEKENEQGDTIEEPKTTGLSELISADKLVSKYRELTIHGPKPDDATQLQADAAQPIVRLLDRIIGMYKPLVEHSYRRSLDQNRLHAAKALVPKQEVIDRLQRYEASLERSFDRTLSQLERLQRVRRGQPVLPALKVDVSH